MSRRSPRRHAAAVTAMTLVFSLGATLAVLVAGSASAAGSKGTTTKKTTTTTTKKKRPTPTPITPTTTAPDTPAAHFFVINGTVNAASDHEIVGSSAFPNFTTGAVDNYYSMAHSHVDNSPFAEGTASPADTGPIGQTAAAGNTQQPQYADARWPGDPPKATYGTQGGPYATAVADEYRATADASEASNGLSAPGPTGATTLAVPKGFDGRLRAALAGWKSTWQGVSPKKKPVPAVTTPVATVTLPTVPKPTSPKAKVTTPTATVTTPVATVTTPNDTAGGGSPAPPVTVPSPTLPSVGAAGAPRTMASASTPSNDGETLLTSSTMATLDSKTNTLVTSGESSLGRVSLGGGAIVIEGIHVTASIANDGTPSYKAAVSVASATIGGVPVTIDQDGVHVAGQGAGLPYQQASDALNGALKQAGIQLFLVGPEVSAPCGQTGTGTGGGTTTTSTTTTTTSATTTTPTTTSNDQSGTPGSCGQTGSTSCDSSGGGGGTGPSLPSVGSSTTTTNSNDQTGTTTTPGSCGQTGSTSCDQTTGTTTNGTTTTGGVTGIGPSTTTSKTTTRTTTTTTTGTSTGQTDTTTTPSGCGQSGTLPSTSSCGKAGTTTGTTSTSTDQTGTTTPPSPFDPMGLGAGSSASSEETVTATGVHLVFTQPVNQSGVPAQFVEHILGEVFVDSLAVPAGNPPNLNLSSSLSSSSSSFSASSCGGGHSSKTTAGGASTAGGSSSAGGSSPAGGSTSSGSLSGSGSTVGSTSQPTSSSTGNSLPAAFASALRKPLWLLLAYVLWQALVIGTGASLWNWRRDGAS